MHSQSASFFCLHFLSNNSHGLRFFRCCVCLLYLFSAVILLFKISLVVLFFFAELISLVRMLAKREIFMGFA